MNDHDNAHRLNILRQRIGVIKEIEVTSKLPSREFSVKVSVYSQPKVDIRLTPEGLRKLLVDANIVKHQRIDDVMDAIDHGYDFPATFKRHR